MDATDCETTNWWLEMTANQSLSIVMSICATALMTYSNWRSTRYQRRIGLLLKKSLFASRVGQLQVRLVGKLPNKESIQSKLSLIDHDLTIRKFWFNQLSYGLVGFGIGLILNINSISEPNILLQIIWLGLVWLGWYFPISSLNSRYRKFQTELNYGFAEVVDLITLSVTAGNSLSNSLISISEVAQQPWRSELELIRHDLISGLSVTTSLERAALRLRHPTFTRFVSSVLITLERGTSLATQLRTQSNEVTESIRRELLNQAGKKETTMLLPVIFLILPTIVIATIFPGILALGKLI